MAERLKTQSQTAVRAILFNDEQKVLLTKRAAGVFEGGKWCLVGGKLDPGEKAADGITREMLEEIGVESSLVYYAEIENPDTSRGTRWITHYFVGQLVTLPEKLDPLEIAEVGFFSQQEIEKLDIVFDHKEVLTNFFKETHS